MWTRIVIEEYYTVCQHSAPTVLNIPTQFSFVSSSAKRCWAQRRQSSLAQTHSGARGTLHRCIDTTVLGQPVPGMWQRGRTLSMFRRHIPGDTVLRTSKLYTSFCIISLAAWGGGTWGYRVEVGRTTSIQHTILEALLVNAAYILIQLISKRAHFEWI
jgi:hypothetical protein